jgi:serine/threonine protein kinase
MAMNVATPTEFPGEPGPQGAKALKPRPPTPAELAAKFPQLEIIELIGQGGMGVVYKARQKALDRLVALKLLAPDKEKDPQFAERFAREAKTLAQLNHPNIVTVHDFGETSGLFYLLMEYVDGLNLRQLLGQHQLTTKEALAIVPVVCDALQFAHDRGVVHRDIKPENVLLDKEGRVKIADFGIARILGRAADGESALGEKAVVGTPRYMAPEQMNCPLEVDHRADIYSLGVVLYELLTGELPKGKFEPPSKKVQIDVRLDEIVLRALENDPDRRYQTAEQFKTMVETVGEPPAGGKTGKKPAASKPTRVSWAALIAAMAAVTLILMAVFFFARHSRTPSSPTSADFRCRVFEADAEFVNSVVPLDTRESSTMPEDGSVRHGNLSSNPAEMAEISQDTLVSLLNNDAEGVALLTENRRKVPFVFWPRLAQAMSYAGTNGVGSLGGFVGVKSERGKLRLRLEYRLTHLHRSTVTSEIFYEGIAPQANRARVFLVPFTRTDGAARCLVAAFETGAAEQQDSATP